MVGGGRWAPLCHPPPPPSASSIYTAEIRAIVLAFIVIIKSHKEHFVICTDSLSCLMAIGHLKQDHPLLHDIFEYHTYAQHQHKSVLFCWVPSHVGIQGNERVDALARLALNESYTNIKIPYADLVCSGADPGHFLGKKQGGQKPHTQKNIIKIGQPRTKIRLKRTPKTH